MYMYSKNSELRPVVELRETVRYLGVAAILRSVFSTTVLVGLWKPIPNSEVSTNRDFTVYIFYTYRPSNYRRLSLRRTPAKTDTSLKKDK